MAAPMSTSRRTIGGVTVPDTALRRMTECLRGIAQARPQTTYDSFIRDFGERFVAGYKLPVSTVDLLSNAPFSE